MEELKNNQLEQTIHIKNDEKEVTKKKIEDIESEPETVEDCDNETETYDKSKEDDDTNNNKEPDRYLGVIIPKYETESNYY